MKTISLTSRPFGLRVVLHSAAILLAAAPSAKAAFSSVTATHQFRMFWSNDIGGAAEFNQTFTSGGSFSQAAQAGVINPVLGSQKTRAAQNFVMGTVSATISPGGRGYSSQNFTFNFSLTEPDTLSMYAFGTGSGGQPFAGGYGLSLRRAGSSTNLASFGGDLTTSSAASIPAAVSLAPGSYSLIANANRSASTVGTTTIEFAAQLSTGQLESDYNGDGAINAADYTMWRDVVGSGNILLNDGTPYRVAQDDLNSFQAGYGLVYNAFAVPEPAGVLGCLFAGVPALRRPSR